MMPALTLEMLDADGVETQGHLVAPCRTRENTHTNTLPLSAPGTEEEASASERTSCETKLLKCPSGV